MVKVYAVSLAVAVVGLIVVIFGGALFESLGRPGLDPGARLGMRGRAALGALGGFAMGGMSAEFSPLDLGWPAALLIAVVAGGLAAVWVRFAVSLTADR